MLRASHLRRTASLALSLAILASAHAEDYTWNGITGTRWNSEFTWARSGGAIGIPPSSYATSLLFTTNGTQLASNNDIAGTLNLGAITFGTRDGWALSGNALGFNTGTITADTSASVANAISVLTGLTSNVAAGKTLSLSGAITGAGSLVKSGAGVLALSGAVTTGGSLTVNGGTVKILGTLGSSAAYVPTILNEGILNIAGNAYVSNLTLTSGTVTGAGTLNLNGNATLNGTVLSNLALTNGAHTVSGTGTISGALSGPGSLNVASGSSLTLAPLADYTFGGTITGAGSLVKSGEGALTLSGAVTPAGGLTVNAGTINLAGLGNSSLYVPTLLNGGTLNIAGNAYVSDLSMASNSTVSGAGTINLTGNATLNGTIGTNIALSQGSSHTFNGGGTISGVISGNTDVTFAPSRLITLGATNTYTGTTTLLGGGDLTIAANDGIGRGGDLLLRNSRFNLSDRQLAPVTQTLSKLNGTGFVSVGNVEDLYRDVRNTLILDITGSSTFEGAFSGFGDLIKRGQGELNYKVDPTEISNASYIGYLNVEAGTVNLSGAASGTRNLDVAAGATLNQSSAGLTMNIGLSGTGTIRLNGGLTLNGAQSTFAGKITGAGPLSFLDSRQNGYTIDLSNIDFSGYTGTISANRSTLSIANAPALPTIGLTNGALLNLREDAASDTTLGALTGTTGTTLAKTGTGNLRIGSANFGGLTRVDAGTLTVNRDALYRSTDGISVSSGGTLAFGGGSASITTKTLTNAGTIVGSGSVSAVFTNGATGTVRTNPAERLAFSGDVTNNGTFTLAGDGEIDVAGRLTNAAGSLVTGRGTLNTGGLFSSGTMAFSGGSSDVYGKVSLLTGSVTQNSGGGALTFWDDVVHNGTEIRTNAGSYTTFKGSVSGAGAYTGPGTVEFDGDLRPGNSPASVNFGGNLVLANTNRLVMELGGTTLGSEYDHLNVGGTAYLDGALNVVSFNGFNPMVGQSFDLFDFTAQQGRFSQITLPTLGNDLAWNTSGLYTTGKISVQAVPEPASLAILGLGLVGVLRRRKR